MSTTKIRPLLDSNGDIVYPLTNINAVTDESGDPLVIDDIPKKDSQNLVKSGGVFNNIGALDVSELNATENPHTLATYASLDLALAAIPSDYRKGGMSIKYVSNSDNKYVQYRLTTDSFSANVVDWKEEENCSGFSMTGISPTLYQGQYTNKGVYTESITGRVTTKVFRVPANTNIRIHINRGYSMVLIAGTNPDFASVNATDLGWVINNASGGDYIYTGGNPYLCLNIAKDNKSVEVSPSNTNNIGLIIGTVDALVFRNKEEERLQVIGTGYMEYWNNVPIFPMRNDTSGFNIAGGAGHKVIPVNAGDTIGVKKASTSGYLQFVKSYHIPTSASNSYDFADGESSKTINSAYEFTVPSDAKYMIVTNVDYEYLTINGYDIFKNPKQHIPTEFSVSQITSESFDTEPTPDSVKLVKSGAIYDYDLKNQLAGNGVAPVIYQGNFTYKGVYDGTSTTRLTTKVFEVDPAKNIYISLGKGYAAYIIDGDDADFSSVNGTDLGKLIHNGSPYVYTGRKRYLALNICQNVTTDTINISEANDINLRICYQDSEYVRDLNKAAIARIDASEGSSWEFMPVFSYRNANDSFDSATNARIHKVIPVHEGDTVVIKKGTNWNFVQFVKSYTIPDNVNNSYDFADGQSSVYINELTTLTVPSGAKYMIVGDQVYKPSILTINEYDVLSGTRELINVNPKGNVMIVGGDWSHTHTSSFSLIAGRKYRLSFAACSRSNSNQIHARSGVYLAVIFNNEYLTGEDDNGNEMILKYTNEESSTQSVTPPVDCLFTPSADGYLDVRTRFTGDCSLVITVTEEHQDLKKLLRDTSLWLENMRDINAWHIEDMIFNGKNIGSPDFTMTYMVGHLWTEGGDCYVAGFFNDNPNASGESSDNKGGLIHFNMANPEKTSEFLVALAPGDVVFEGESIVCGGVKTTVAAQIDDDTIRVMMCIGNMDVYKDYTISTKTFETYCHRCKINISGTDYNLNFTDGYTVRQLLNLQMYGTNEPYSTANLISFTNNPIKFGDYWYEVFNFYGWSRAILRTQDFETWEFWQEIPYPYLTDEFQLCCIYNRIYVACTGNLGRRENGGTSAILYYNLTQDRGWSSPVYFEPYYGQDVAGLAAVDGRIYVMHQRLGVNNVDAGYSYENITRRDNYPNSEQVKRSIKSIFVLDEKMTILNRIDLRVRRGLMTSHFGVYKGNLYAFVATTPKILENTNERQTAMFSYVDVRFLNI